MAYILKYKSTFFQNNKDLDKEYEVQIFQDGFGSSSTTIVLDDKPVEIRREGDMFQVIQGSEMIVRVKSETDLFFKEFFNAPFADYLVRLVEDPNGTPIIKWEGYNQPKTYTEPYVAVPYTSEIKFVCGLKNLQYKLFDSSGTLHTGLRNMSWVILTCLEQITTLKTHTIREIINIYENSHSSGATNSPLNQTNVDVTLYKDIDDKDPDNVTEKAWTCHKVLTKLLESFLCNIYQWNGIFYIVNVQQHDLSSATHRNFVSTSKLSVNSSGTTTISKSLTNVDKGNPNELLFLGGSAELSTIEPINRLIITYETQNVDFLRDSITSNSDFIYAKSSGVVPLHWDLIGGGPSTTHYSLLDEGFRYFGFEKLPEYKASAISAIGLENESLNVVVNTLDKFNLSFKILCEAYNADAYVDPAFGGVPLPHAQSNKGYTFLRNSARVWFPIQIKLEAAGETTKYLVGSNLGDTPVWSATPGHYIHGFNFSASNTFLMRDDDLIDWITRSYPLSSGSDILSRGRKFVFNSNVSLQTPLLPFTSSVATITYTVGRSYNNIEVYSLDSVATHGVIDGAWCAVIRAQTSKHELTYVTDSDPVSEVIINQTIDEAEELFEIDVTHGDGPSSISQGSFRLAGAATSDSWDRRGAADNKQILELFALMIRDLRGEFKRLITGILVGEIEPFNTLEITETSGTIRYKPEGFIWTPHNGEYNIDLFEIDVTLPAVTVVVSLPPIKLLEPIEEFPIILATVNNQSVKTFKTNAGATSKINEEFIKAIDFPIDPAFNVNFNDNNTSIVQDYSDGPTTSFGVASNLTITADTIGFKGEFNGTSSEINHGNFTELSGKTSATIHIDFFTDTTSNTGNIIYKNGQLDITWNGATFVAFLVVASGAARVLKAVSGGDLNQFNRYTLIYASNVLSLYQDDVLLDTDNTKNGAIVTSSSNMIIGSRLGSNYSKFKLRSIYIYDVAVSVPDGISTLNTLDQGVVIDTIEEHDWELGDILQHRGEGSDTDKLAIVTLVEHAKRVRVNLLDEVLFVDLIFSRSGSIKDANRTSYMLINDDPSMAFYQGVSESAEIDAVGNKTLEFNEEGIFQLPSITTTTYLALTTDKYINLQGSASFTVFLQPSPPNGKELVIYDATGFLATNTVTVDAQSGQTVNGSQTYAMSSARQSITIIYDSTRNEWNIV